MEEDSCQDLLLGLISWMERLLSRGSAVEQPPAFYLSGLNKVAQKLIRILKHGNKRNNSAVIKNNQFHLF